MSKITKIVLIGIFCGASFVFVQPVLAAGLVVQFETAPLPLFQEANFLPGEGVTRWVDVTNNSGETKKIGVKIINKSSCSVDCLSDKLDLVISKNGSPLQLGTLTTFYGAGEQVLSDLNTGATTRYYFSMTFNPGAGNIYQNSTTNFDIKIGFFGEESISQEITPGGGGGGGSFIASGLIISKETVSSVGINTVTIIWDTNYNSTSRVIYSPEGFPHLLQVNNPPNYGYVFSTDEDSNKVISHLVTITGLLPGTTYYYRCVSHGSLAITQEYFFTTLGQKQEITVTPPQETSQIEQDNGLIEQGFEAVVGGLQKVVSAITRQSRGSEKITEIVQANEQPIVEPIVEDMQAAEASGEATAKIPAKGLLATIAGFGLRGWLIIIIISLLALLVIFFLARRERKNKNQISIK